MQDNVYAPSSEEIPVDSVEDSGDEQFGGSFTPVKVPTGDTDKYAGVSIKQLPNYTDQGENVESPVYCRAARRQEG